MIHTGAMLVYFNRHQDAPRVWCVAPPDRAWEIQVQTITVAVPTSTHYEYQPPVLGHDGPPSAVFQMHGRLVVDDKGNATITETNPEP